MASTKSQNTPAHMQESTEAYDPPSDSDVSAADTAVEGSDSQGAKQSDLNNANKKVEVMEKLLKRKAKVGEVELDPEIGGICSLQSSSI